MDLSRWVAWDFEPNARCIRCVHYEVQYRVALFGCAEGIAPSTHLTFQLKEQVSIHSQYLCIDVKSKLKLVSRINKHFAKFDLTNAELGIITS